MTWQWRYSKNSNPANTEVELFSNIIYLAIKIFRSDDARSERDIDWDSNTEPGSELADLQANSSLIPDSASAISSYQGVWGYWCFCKLWSNRDSLASRLMPCASYLFSHKRSREVSEGTDPLWITGILGALETRYQTGALSFGPSERPHTEDLPHGRNDNIVASI